MQTTYKNRTIECEIEFSRYETDCYIAQAFYIDNDQVIDDSEELEEITNDNLDLIYEQWYDYMIVEAEYRFEGER